MPKRIVVVGGGAAGASAAARARRLDPEAEVILIEATSMITHAPCGIPFAVAGVVPDYRELQMYTPREFAEKRRVKVLTNTRVLDVNVDEQFVVVEGPNGMDKIAWDKLIIATGAKPLIPPIPGVDLKGIITLRHPTDVPSIRQELIKAKTVGVVGAGYIGVEMAEALLHLGKRVLVFEMYPQVLPGALDADVAEIVEGEMRSAGVELHLAERVVEFRGANGHVARVVTERGEYPVDKVVLAVGVRPNTDLAVKAGIKLGETKAIEVNEYMETSAPNVYAAGDVAEKRHRITGRRVWIPLAPTANKEGQVAGANAARGRILKFPGVVGTAITKFRELYIARTGLTVREAENEGFKVMSKLVKAKTRSHYYPDAKPVYVKLIAEEGSGRILGFEAAGWDPIIASYADMVALAIEANMTIEDLFFSDIGYMPAAAPVWHPVIVAARVLSGGKF